TKCRLPCWNLSDLLIPYSSISSLTRSLFPAFVYFLIPLVLVSHVFPRLTSRIYLHISSPRFSAGLYHPCVNMLVAIIHCTVVQRTQ
ncbi:hypothetical protein EDB19DRAFT_1757321, partial [Suillus lakei]